MAGVNQLLPFANGETPNVLSYDEWNALAARLSGFQSGIASSKQFNYILAQGGAAGYVIGQMVADYTTETATIAATPLYQAFQQALASFVSGSTVTAKGTTTPRSLEDRFSDVVNVLDFGAKRDGVTDDTDAFNQAGATGKRVFVPQGRYLITDTVDGDFYSDGNVATDYTKISIGSNPFMGGVKQVFVDAENGSDYNDGTSTASAVKTMQRAINIANQGIAPQITIQLMGNSIYEVPSNLFVFSGAAPHVSAYNGSPTLKFMYTGGTGPRFYSSHVNFGGSDSGNLIIDSAFNSMYFEGCSCTFSKVSFKVAVGVYGGNVASNDCSYMRVPNSDTDLGGLGRKPALYLYMANGRFNNTTIASTDGVSTGIAAAHGSNVAIYGTLNVVEQDNSGTQPVVLSYNSYLTLNYTSNANTFTNKYNRSVTLNWSTCKVTEECFEVIQQVNPFYTSSAMIVGTNVIGGLTAGQTFNSTRLWVGGHITGGGVYVNFSIPYTNVLAPNVSGVTVSFDQVTIRGIDGYIVDNVTEAATGTVSVTYFNQYQINVQIELSSGNQKPEINNTPVAVELIGLNITAS